MMYETEEETVAQNTNERFATIGHLHSSEIRDIII